MWSGLQRGENNNQTRVGAGGAENRLSLINCCVAKRLQQGGLVDRPRQSRPESATMVEGAYRPAFGLVSSCLRLARAGKCVWRGRKHFWNGDRLRSASFECSLEPWDRRDVRRSEQEFVSKR